MLIGLYNTRDTLITFGFLSYLYKLKPDIFNIYYVMIIGLCLICGNILDSYQNYLNTISFNNNVQKVYYAIIGLPLLIMTYKNIECMHYIYKKMRIGMTSLDIFTILYCTSFYIYFIFDWCLPTLIPTLYDDPNWYTIYYTYISYIKFHIYVHILNFVYVYILFISFFCSICLIYRQTTGETYFTLMSLLILGILIVCIVISNRIVRHEMVSS